MNTEREENNMGVALWRVILGVCLGACLALGSWTLSAVANIPKEYVQKDDFNQLRKENREDHKDIMNAIRRLTEGRK
jgi:hypothetical protein